MKTQVRCDQCQLVRINGMVCHEIGCPIAWKDDVRECRECGCEFGPEFRRQTVCNDCAEQLAQ
jgi:hypothetical protein